MTHPKISSELPALQERLRRSNLPEWCADMSLWPSYDDSLLAGKDKIRYRNLRDATALYMNGRPMAEVTAKAGIGDRRFHRIFQRVFMRDSAGQILGCRAFARGAHIAPPNVTKLKEASSGGRGGFYGAFRLLLREYPNITAQLITYLNGHGVEGLRPNRVLFRQIRRKFLEICKTEKVPTDGYPFNTKEGGRRSLRRWIDSDYMSMYARRFITLENGKDAGDLIGYGEGSGTSTRPLGGSGTWILDANTVDVYARYEIPTPAGDWQSLALRRFQQLRVIHKQTSANLACCQVYSAQPTAQDVAILLWDALNGPPQVQQVVPGMTAEPGAEYPANAIPEFRFAVPTAVELDNALAHLADDVQHTVAHLFGARVILGAPKTPHERAAIESKFAAQARRVLHQLPGTAGSGPKDPMRKTHEVETDKMIRANELEQVLDVYVKNENALPAAGSFNVAPLVRLKRLLETGAIKPNYLPPDKRKAHFFCRPHKVKVRIDKASGRAPYINFLYARYSSGALGKRFDLQGQTMYARADPRNIRTIMLFTEAGAEFGPVQALGSWGCFPHDLRFRRIFGKLKRDGELGPRADDRPLESVFAHLRNKAPRDSTKALQLASIVEYLQRQDFVMSPALAQSAKDWKQMTKVAETIAVIPVAIVTGEKPAAAMPAAPTAKAKSRWALPMRPMRSN
jgi:putative transposase